MADYGNEMGIPTIGGFARALVESAIAWSKGTRDFLQRRFRTFFQLIAKTSKKA